LDILRQWCCRTQEDQRR